MTTISYISAASANGTSLLMPTHAAGDILIFAAYRDGSNTAPAIPSGWLTVNTGTGSNSNTMTVAFKIAASAAETSGTWTNASQVACGVYRATTQVAPGGFRSTANASSLTVSWAATPTGQTTAVARQNGSTWFVGIVGYKTNDVDCEVAPSGMTQRTNTKGASTGQIALHDTNGDSALWTTTSQTYSTGTAAASYTLIVELVDTGRSTASSGGAIGGGNMRGGLQ